MNADLPVRDEVLVDDLPDDQLWVAARNGNGAAYGVLFDRHSTKIYNYCYRRTADWATAQDVMASTFLEAWRRRDLCPTGDSTLPLLLGIATNLLRNHRRSIRRYEAALRAIPRDQPATDHADAVVAAVDYERDVASMLRALSELNTRERDVLTLTSWSGLSYQQTSEALGIPIGTVRSTISRAREKVANLMELDPLSGHYKGTRPLAAPSKRN